MLPCSVTLRPTSRVNYMWCVILTLRETSHLDHATRNAAYCKLFSGSVQVRLVLCLVVASRSRTASGPTGDQLDGLESEGTPTE